MTPPSREVRDRAGGGRRVGREVAGGAGVNRAPSPPSTHMQSVTAGSAPSWKITPAFLLPQMSQLSKRPFVPASEKNTPDACPSWNLRRHHCGRGGRVKVRERGDSRGSPDMSEGRWGHAPQKTRGEDKSCPSHPPAHLQLVRTGSEPSSIWAPDALLPQMSQRSSRPLVPAPVILKPVLNPPRIL